MCIFFLCYIYYIYTYILFRTAQINWLGAVLTVLLSNAYLSLSFTVLQVLIYKHIFAKCHLIEALNNTLFMHVTIFF